MIRANFRITKPSKIKEDENKEIPASKKEMTKSEFEEFMVKSGASGSFMVFRSDKKDSELGLDEL